MTAHRIIDFVNGLLALGYVFVMLPDTRGGMVVEAALVPIVMYPILDPIMTTRQYLIYALWMFVSVSLLQLFVAPKVTFPAELTFAILVVSIVGWLVTRKRDAARTHSR